MKQCADDVRAAYPLFQGEGGGANPTSALQLRIVEIDPRRAMEMNRVWHSVLPDTYYPNIVGCRRWVCFGAEFNERFFAVAIWTRPVAANRMNDADATLELRRLAIAPDAPKNTASRMLAVMARLIGQKWPGEIRRLISYQATDVHLGTIYRAAGWTAGPRSKFKEWLPRYQRRSLLPVSRRQPQNRGDKVRWEKPIRLLTKV